MIYSFQLVEAPPKAVVVPKPLNLAEFIDNGWATWRGPIDGDGLSGEEDVDLRSLSLATIRVDDFVFETCLKKGEESIIGEEKLRRLRKKSGFISFGENVFCQLWLDYRTNKENSILKWLHRHQGITFIDFMGRIFRGPGGRRNVLCLSGKGCWSWGYRWLDYPWDIRFPSIGCTS